MTQDFEPCAAWTPDCQGKWDYDGRLLSISTRYYPGPEGGGAMTFDTATSAFGTLPYGPRPHAHAAIHLNHGEPDRYGYGDYLVLREAEFDADTEAEVKALVEAWVTAQVNDIARLLARANPVAF